MKALSILLFAAFSAYCVAADLKSEDMHKRFLAPMDYKGGVAAIEREISVHPADAGLLVALGMLHICFDKYPEAKTALERALAIAPNHAKAHNYLGIVHFSMGGDQAAALKELDLAIKSNPGYADAHFNREVVLANSVPPNMPAARASYERAISLGAERDKALEQDIK